MKLIATLLFISLFAFAHAQWDSLVKKDIVLYPLSSFPRTTDSTGGIIQHNYPALNLKIENGRGSACVYFNNNKVFEGRSANNTRVLEIFDKSYLLITFSKNQSYIASPYHIRRDSVIIVNLRTGNLKFATLKGFELVLSKKLLLEYYSRHDDPQALDLGNIIHAALESIDFAANKLIVTDQYGKLREFKMTDLSAPFLEND